MRLKRSLKKHSALAKGFDAVAAFELGRHLEVVERVLAPGGPPEETMALIGSLAFLGRLDEALAFWNVSRDRLTPLLRARARFAIGLAFTRVSKFKSAREFFSENSKDRECRGCADIYQGIGIFYYYRGQFKKTAIYARKSLRLALENGDNFIHALAIDLLGHTLCQSGRRSVGTRLLSQGQKQAGVSGEHDTLSAERLFYEAQAGMRPEAIVAEIRDMIATRGANNSYTRANLILELARQMTLRGEWAEARKLLNDEAANIYAFENRRQETTLQLRLAELSYRQGDGPGAMHILQGARRCVDIICDRSFEIRVLGLEAKVEKNLFGHEPSTNQQARLRELSREFPNSTNTRIVNRTRGKIEKILPDGEDPLGDLLDLVSRDPSLGANELLKRGYLGLWPEAAGIRPGEERMIIFESGHWLGLRKSGVVKSVSALSQTSRKMLQALSLGVQNKERLLKNVWGYHYDPLRHDAMIYAALTALRKSLGEMTLWIETHDNGWSLGACIFIGGAGHRAAPPESIELAESGDKVESLAPMFEKIVHFAEERHLDLNWRQIKALNELMDNERKVAWWTAPVYRTEFNVSLMTAWRDLDELVKKKYLVRVGRGRLTSYRKGELLK
jgi:tetratricopeptide (TPR) repeat protein